VSFRLATKGEPQERENTTAQLSGVRVQKAAGQKVIQ